MKSARYNRRWSIFDLISSANLALSPRDEDDDEAGDDAETITAVDVGARWGAYTLYGVDVEARRWALVNAAILR